MAEKRLVVVKVGGSLYDLPDLGERLGRFLDRDEVRPALLVPGGGGPVEALRQLHRVRNLSEETSHWLALHALAVAARSLARLVPDSSIVAGPEEAEVVWRQGGVPVLDARRFAERDEGRPGALPHSWQVTSDSIAARLAVVGRACRLILLKSVTFPQPPDWALASRQGLVDEHFPEVLKQAAGLEVLAVNLRRAPDR